MTNRELLAITKDRLHGANQQRQHLLQMANCAMPCPACQEPLNVFEAAGIGVNDYDFGRSQHNYSCPTAKQFWSKSFRC